VNNFFKSLTFFGVSGMTPAIPLTHFGTKSMNRKSMLHLHSYIQSLQTEFR
jgi:hypothetical protein